MAKNATVFKQRLHEQVVNIWLKGNGNEDYEDDTAYAKAAISAVTRPRILENKEAEGVSASYSNCLVVKIFSDYGYFIAVRKNIVKGFRDDKLQKDDGIFELQTYGRSLVRLLDTKSQKYLSITNRGDVIPVREKTDETLFKHKLEENHFDTFASHKYFLKDFPRELFLTINHNGKILPGWKKRQRSRRTFNYKTIDHGECRRSS